MGKICLYFIDAFDDLWNHLRNLIEQSELSAEKPVVHKWNAIFTKAKEQSKRLSDACDKIALKHTKDTLRKLMTKIKELTEIEHNHAQLRGGGERTSEGEKQIATCDFIRHKKYPGSEHPAHGPIGQVWGCISVE